MQIEMVFARLEDKKKQLKDRKQRLQDELKSNPRYIEIEERIAELKAERKQIEMTMMTEDDRAEIEGMKADIKTDKVLLTDLTLNKYVAGETCEIIDEFRRPYEPRFSVSFKKV